MYEKRYIQEDKANGGVRAVYLVMAVTVFAYVLQRISGGVAMQSEMSLLPAALREGEVWRLFSYMFVHDQRSIIHILFNMMALYFIGTFVGSMLGANRFLSLYFLSGLAGGLLWTAFNWNSTIPVIGASGAIYGVMMAAAMLAPNVEVMLILPPVPMKLKTMMIAFIIIDSLGSLAQASDSLSARMLMIGHLAHLGGLVGGYLYIKVLYKKPAWDPLGFLFPGSTGAASTPPGWSVLNSSAQKKTESLNNLIPQGEIDRLLDKISASGINSLSDAEIALLKRAREQLKSR